MILVFSGTGNSMLVAKELQQQLGGEIVTLEGDMLLNAASQKIVVPSTEQLVWVMPVYSWGVPPVVETFIKKVKIKSDQEVMHYLVLTCGDDIGLADNQWSKLIGRRGWSPRGTFSVTMPNTYVCMKGFDVDTPEAAAAKVAAMPARVREIAEKIRRRFSDSDVTRGSWAWVKSAIIYPYFKAFCMSPKPFATTPDCNGCGKCARNCPLHNITISTSQHPPLNTTSATLDDEPTSHNADATSHNPTPQWGNHCALCLRCYHGCPAHAVTYGKATAGKSQKPLTLR
jgi:ferredoxin/flavodoxin